MDERKKQLENIKLESLLFSSEFDEMVELLPSLFRLSTDNIVIVYCHPPETKDHRLNYKFLIAKDTKGNFFYIHQGYAELRIRDSALLDRLSSVILQQNQPVAIEWDDFLYPQIMKLIRSKLGHDVTVPFTLSQLQCSRKLELIVAMRKTYLAIGGKYINSFEKSQAFRKLYSQYLDELLLCNSLEALSTLKQNLLDDSLLLLPLDLSWIVNPSSDKEDSKDLHMSVVAYNCHPTFTRMLVVIRSFHDYHQASISQPQKRLAYLSHLSTDAFSSGLKELYDQLCTALQIFCDEDQIDGELQTVPSLASSEMLFVHIVPSLTDKEQNRQDFQQIISTICEQQPPVFTVIDSFLNRFAQFSETLLEIEMPKREMLLHPADDFSFDERYAVFQALPSVQATLSAISVYPKHYFEQLHHQKLKKLLEYVYSILHSCLSNFNPQMAIDGLVHVLNDAGLKPDEMYEALEILPNVADKQVPLFSLIHLLKQVHSLLTWETTLSEDVSVGENEGIDLKKLLTRVPEYFQELQMFLEKLGSFTIVFHEREQIIAARDQTLSAYTNIIAAICNAVHRYPMAVSRPTLQLWAKYLKDIMTILEREYLDYDTSDTIIVKLTNLKTVIQESISDFTSISNLCCELKTAAHASALDQYNILHQADDHRRAKLLIQYNLALEKRFYSTPCVDTLSKWLYPGLMAQGRPYHVTIVTERLKPSYDVRIQSQEPNEDTVVDTPTVFLFPSKANLGQWKICTIDHFPNDPNSYTFHYRDVSDDLINTVLDESVQQSVHESVGHLQLSKEQKAEILSKLNYEQEEFMIQHKVSLHEQALVDEINIQFSLVAISTVTSRVLLHKNPTDVENLKRQIDEKDMLIVQCQLNTQTRRALETLGISDHQLSTSQELPAVCIVKYPGQPAMFQFVYKCGDKVEHDFSYVLPLIIDHFSYNGNKPFFEQLRPLTDLLNQYHHFYQSLLPIDHLNVALQVSLKYCGKIVFHTSIPQLVMAVRRHFIQECLKARSNLFELPNIQAMQRSITDMLKPSTENPIQNHMYLTGLESFLYFYLAKSKESNFPRFLQCKKKETENMHYQLWNSVLQEVTIHPEEFQCLCLAFAFLDNPQRIDNHLHDETSAVRFQMYQSISDGLQILESCQSVVHGTKDDGAQITIIKQLLEMISTYQEHHSLGALYEASLEIEDDKNLDSLLEMVLSTAPLQEHLFRYLQDKHLSDQESCFRLLKQLDFFDDVYEKVLAWSMEQQKGLLAKLQHIISDPMFTQSTGKEEFISTVSSWLLERTEIALSEYNWKELELVYLIIEMLMLSMISDVHAIRQKKDGTIATEPSDLLSNSLTVVQVFDASLDVSSIAVVMTSVPSGQWLKYLLIQNLLLVCAEHFGVHSTDDIQEQLLYIDTKLIQIFYNVFIEEQYNRDDTESSSLGKISASQLNGIFDWLPFIEPVPDACSTLCMTALSMWEKELAEIHFKQYFDLWQGLTDADKKRTTYLLNRVRLNEHRSVRHSEFMSTLSMIRDQYIISASEDSGPLLVLVEHLYYKRITLDQAKTVVVSHQYREWCEQLNGLITEGHESHKPRSMEKVLDLIRKQVQSGSYKMTMDEFELLQKEALQISKQVKELTKRNNPKVEKTIKKFLKGLQRHVTLAKKQLWLTKHRVKFVIHLLGAWILVASRSGEKIDPFNTQVISLLLFLHSEECGLLQQMKTGEGKTAVVGLLAASKALLGFNVDIVTSNRDLAKEGLKKCQPLFTFLSLQGAVNCTDDNDTNQQAYKSHIVYGDVDSFQRDVLSEEMEAGHANFIARYSDPQMFCLLVDEVDSMFLDKGQHMLYISHESPALKHLESLFIMIWSSVLSINPENESGDIPIDSKLNQMAKDLNTLIRNETISVPDYLTDFCSRKMKSWVYSAYQARFMEADDQFIIDHKSSDDDEQAESAKQIFPMDKHTGIEEYNMKWTNGLFLFLELKYRRALSSESLKAVFISNLRFFKHYGSTLYGLTGTLGSLTSRRLLQGVYNIITVNIPTNRPKRYTRQKSRVACNDKQWCEEIHKEICEHNTEHPILVICESIKRLKDLQAHLEEKGKTDIIYYARDGDDVENTLKKQGGASRGQIILATNKGGRGTDIKIKKEDRHKGLHVIVSFLPENSRIEEQAFGRAARAGQPGSGCLVLQIDPSEYQAEIKTFETVAAATETLIEIEKIRRDQSESDRIGLLLKEGIPQLDLEENLYQSFRDYRKKFESSLEGVELLGVEVSGELKKACVTVVTDQWAYWLDSVSDKMRAADCAEKHQAIIDDFNQEFLSPRLNASISSTDSFLFSTPEYCILFGQAMIKDKKFVAAQKCFDLAIDKGDKTGLAAMSACYCFCSIKSNSKPSPKNKKECRHYLKIAKSKLDALRQSWMSNGEIGKALGDLVDVSQYVEDEENNYTRQISEKLKVIGLHLNTLESLLGSGLDESSFVKESKLDVERLTAEESRKVYHKLVDSGIICHFKVRSCWKKQDKLKPLIRKEVEPQISESLIGCITENTSVTEEHMTGFVYSSDKLWEILTPLMEETEAVVVLEVSQVEDKLTDDDLRQLWERLRDSFSDRLTSSTAQLPLPFKDKIYKQLQTKEYEPLTIHLKGNALYHESYRGMIRHDACDLIKDLDLDKYEECKIKTEDGASEQRLREFLAQLFKFCQEHEQGYCYEHMLPFDRQAVEAKKLHGFLQEHEILKSGVLIWHEDYTNDDEIESSVKKALGKDYHAEQLTFIVKAVQGLRGEVRAFKRKMTVGFVDFYDLKDHPEDIPQTLDFFTSWHLDYFLTLEQVDKGWWDWNAFAVAMMGLAQVIAGVALVTLTVGFASTIGSALIAEGINDMVYATIAGITGTFSWKEWAIQKAISVAISIATAGIGALAAPAKIAVKVGSAARYSTFAKTLAKAAGEFVVNAAAGIVTDVLLADVQERVVATIVNEIEKKLFSQITEKLRVQLVELATHKSSDDEFHEHSQKIVQELQSALGLNNTTVSDAFDQLGFAVASSLKKNYKAIANNLSKSKSVWAKMASAGMKAASMAEMIYTAINLGVSLARAVDAMVKLADIQPTGEAVRSESDVDDTIVQRELDEIRQCFQQFAQKQLQQKLKGVLQSTIKGSMKGVARAGQKTVSGHLKRTFNGKTSSQVVKDLYVKNQKITLVSDFADERHPSTSKKQKPPKPMTEAEKKDCEFQERREKLKGTVLKPHKKTLSQNERSRVEQTLQHTGGKLPPKHELHPDKLATGYSGDRGPELERIPLRKRADSQGHLSLPSANSDLEQNKTRPRANTNCPLTKTAETQPTKRTGVSDIRNGAQNGSASERDHSRDGLGSSTTENQHIGAAQGRSITTGTEQIVTQGSSTTNHLPVYQKHQLNGKESVQCSYIGSKEHVEGVDRNKGGGKDQRGGPSDKTSGGATKDDKTSEKEHGGAMKDDKTSEKEHGATKDDKTSGKEHGATKDGRASGKEHGGAMKDDKTSRKEHGGAMKDDKTSGKEHGGAMKDDKTSGKEHGATKDDKTSGKEHGGAMKDDKTSGKEHGGATKDDKTSGKEHGGAMKDDKSSGKEHGGATKDDKSSGKEHGGATKDDKTSGKEHGEATKDDKSSGKEHGGATKDDKSSGKEHGGATKDDKTSGKEHGGATKDNKTSRKEHGGATKDDKTSGKEHGGAAEDGNTLSIKELLERHKNDLPEGCEHHPDNFATGYLRDRGPDLEMMEQRKRADSHVPLSQSGLDYIRTRPRAMTNDPRRKKKQYVYVFNQLNFDGKPSDFIKVGKTKQEVNKRRSDEQAGNPNRLEVYKTFPVTPNTEKRLKQCEDAAKKVLGKVNVHKLYKQAGGVEWFRIKQKDRRRAMNRVKKAVTKPSKYKDFLFLPSKK